LCTLQGACQSQRAMPPYCRGSKHQKNGLAPLEERKRLCDPPNLPNLISFICLFPINMQPLALFLRKEPGGLSSISNHFRVVLFLRLLVKAASGFRWSIDCRLTGCIRIDGSVERRSFS